MNLLFTSSAIEISEKQHLHIQTDALMPEQLYDVTYLNQRVGHVRKSNGSLLLMIDQVVPSLTLTGTFTATMCHIIANGNLTIDAWFNKVENLVVSCQDLNWDSLAGGVRTTLKAQGRLEINGVLQGDVNDLSAQTMQITARPNNEPALIAKINKLSAESTIELHGGIVTTLKGRMAAPRIEQYSHIESFNQLVLLSDDYLCHPISTTQVHGLFRFFGARWQMDGKYSFGQAAFIVAEEVIDSGQFTWPHRLYFQSKTVQITQTAKTTWSSEDESTSELRQFHVDSKVTIDNQAGFSVKAAILNSNEIDAQGRFSVKKGAKVSGAHLIVTQKSVIKNSTVQFNKLKTLAQGQLTTSNSAIQIETLAHASQGEWQDNGSTITIQQGGLSGPLSWRQTRFFSATKSQFSSKGSLTDCQLAINTWYYNAGDTLTFNNCTFSLHKLALTSNLSLDYSNRLNAAVFNIPRNLQLFIERLGIDFSAKVQGEGKFEVSILAIGAAGEVQILQSISVVADTFYVEPNGFCQFNENSLQINHLQNQGVLHVVNSNAAITNETQTTGFFSLTNSNFDTNRLSLGGTYVITNSDVNYETITHHGKGHIDQDSTLNGSNEIIVTGALLKVCNSQNLSNLSQNNGTAHYQSSKLSVDISSTPTGQTILEDTLVEVLTQMTADPLSQFEASGSTFHAPQGTLFLAGESKLENNQGGVQNMALVGPAALNKTDFAVKQDAILNHGQTLNDSTIGGGTVTVLGKVTLDASSNLYGHDELSITESALVEASHDSNVASGNRFNAYGRLTITYGAKAMARIFEAYGKFKVGLKSVLDASETVTFYPDSILTLDGGKVQGGAVVLEGDINGPGGVIYADGKLSMRSGALSTTENLGLQARDMWISPTAVINGRDLWVKTKECYENNGVVQLGNIYSVYSNGFLYEAGSCVETQGKSFIQADYAALRFGALIDSPDVEERAPFTLGIMSMTRARNRLDRQSLVHFGFGDIASSNNNVSSSLLSVTSACFSLPDAPNTLGAFLNPAFLLTACEMMACAVVPQFGNTINLVARATPLLFKGGKYLWHVIQNPQQSLQSVQASISAVKHWRAPDYMQAGLTVKSLVMAGIGLAHIIEHAPGEWTMSNLEAIPHQIDQPSGIALVKAADAVFGSMNRQETFVRISADFQGDNNNMNTAFVALDGGISASLQTVERTKYKTNQGISVAACLSTTGTSYTNSGEVFVADTFSEDYPAVDWGSMHVGSLSARNTQVDNFQDFFNTRGEFAKVDVRNDMSLDNPNEDFVVDQNITRPTGVHLRGKHVEITHEQTSEHERGFSAAEGDLKINVPISADGGVRLAADEGSVFVNDSKLSAKSGRVSIRARYNITTDESEVSGVVTTLDAAKGKVTIIGSDVLGGEVEINGDTGVDILAKAKTSTRHGNRHTTQKESNVFGGKGTNHTGVLITAAHGEVNVVGSHVIGKGDVIIASRDHIESRPAVAEDVTHHHHSSWLGAHQEDSVVTETKITQSVIGSEEGNYQFYTKQGDANFYATVLKTETEPVIHVGHRDHKHDIGFYDVVGKRTEYSDDSWFGVFKSSGYYMDEFSAETCLITKAEMPMHFSTTGRIITRSVNMEGGVTDFTAEAWENSASVLHHQSKTTSNWATLSVGGVKVCGLSEPSNRPRQPYNPFSSTIDKLNAVKKGNGTQTELATVSAALEVLNDANETVNATQTKDYLSPVLDHLGFQNAKNPSIKLTLGHTSTYNEYETVATSHMHFSAMHLHLKNRASFQGAEVVDDGDLDGEFKGIDLTGTLLQSYSTSSSSEIGFSSSLRSIYDINTSASSSRSMQRGNNYVNSHFTVKGATTCKNSDFNLDGGVFNTHKLDGHITKVKLVSEYSERESEQFSVGGGLDGSFSLQMHRAKSLTVDEQTTLHADEVSKNCSIGPVESEGGALTTDGKLQNEPKTDSKPKAEFRKESGFGISGNWHDLQAKPPMPQASPASDQPALKLPSLRLNYDEVDYQATSGSTSGHNVSRNVNRHYAVDIPLPDARASRQVSNNIHKAGQQIVGFFSPKKPQRVILKDMVVTTSRLSAAKPKKPKTGITKPAIRKKTPVKNQHLRRLVLPLDDSAMHASLTLDTNVTYINRGKQASVKSSKRNHFFIEDAQAQEPTSIKSTNAPENDLSLTSSDGTYFYINNSECSDTESTTHVRLRGVGNVIMGVSEGLIALAATETVVGATLAGTTTIKAMDDIKTGLQNLLTGKDTESVIMSVSSSLGYTEEQTELLQRILFTTQEALEKGHLVELHLSGSTVLASSAGGAVSAVSVPQKNGHWETRIKGAMEIILGAVESTVGGAEALATLETVAGPVMGGLIVADGFDEIQAGFEALVTGHDGKTHYVVIATEGLGIPEDLAVLGKDVFLAVPAASIALRQLIKESAMSGFSIKSIGLWSRKPNPDYVIAEVDTLLPTGRTRMDQASYDQFIKNVDRYEIRKPLTIYEATTGETYVLNGNSRHDAALELGYKEVPAKRVDLPYRQFKTEEDLIPTNTSYTQITRTFN